LHASDERYVVLIDINDTLLNDFKRLLRNLHKTARQKPSGPVYTQEKFRYIEPSNEGDP